MNDDEIATENSSDCGYEDVAQKKGRSLRSSERTSMACLNLFLKELNDKKKEKYPYSSLNYFWDVSPFFIRNERG